MEKLSRNKYCKIVDIAVPVDHRIKLKQYEKKDKNLDLARELLKVLEDFEFGGRAETIQTTALLRKAGILRRVLET